MILDIDRAYEPGSVLALASRIGGIIHATSSDDPLMTAAALPAEATTIIAVSPAHFHGVALEREAKQRGITYVRCG